MKLTIRTATENDLDACARLLTQLFSIEEDFVIDTEKQLKGLRLLLAEPERCRIFVAEFEDEIIGMCAVQLLVSTAEGGPVMLFEDFIVSESHRSRGIGAQLIQAAEAWGKSHHATRFQLLADKDNRKALDFYQNHGWNRTNLTYLFKKKEI